MIPYMQNTETKFSLTLRETAAAAPGGTYSNEKTKSSIERESEIESEILRAPLCLVAMDL